MRESLAALDGAARRAYSLPMDKKIIETAEARRRRIMSEAFYAGYNAHDRDVTGLTFWERWFVYMPAFRRGQGLGRP